MSTINIPEHIVTIDAAAAHCALIWHKNHKRRYTGEDYAIHLGEVAGLSSLIPPTPECKPEIIRAIAWLHDVVEDIKVSYNTIRSTFRRFPKEDVAKMLHGISVLTDAPGRNRAHTVAKTIVRLADAPGYLQDLKCLDSFSNTNSIMVHDLPFLFGTYIYEKRALLGALTLGTPFIRKMAKDSLARAEAHRVQLKLQEMEHQHAG